MKYLPLILSIISVNAFAISLNDCTLSESQEEDSIAEHLWGGPLDNSELFERRAYVFSYNKEHLVPRWAAWHATKPYRDTPKRKSRWSTFRRDPELTTVSTKDYVGWFHSDDNFARGHIVPYFISGGDRDHDGLDAEIEETLAVEDIDDACTVLEINSMANIAPQYHSRFNGQPGLWWLLESDVRNLIDNGRDLQLLAGTVFIDDVEVEKIGNREKSKSKWKIGVPHGFFKVVVDPDRNEAVAFLFDHSGDVEGGCSIDDPANKWPSECIVSIDVVEAATGLSFFSEIEEGKKLLRESSTKGTWLEWLGIE
ncbi:DNA/RNA non-specific endonuclease [Sessilibacter corallicola]|uniref:DNA/RNA non-specific endonuclease n=1 Tax=Sessilibacter corallicola TaxID=2904075 RepID=UPI001E4828C8|nr:DNA/RNA non-specific endonuclease [Sessilibacter corallicola]MCE2029306.1 DNA/RNA non-specific endonuclease [Sessilibacter corallicola]